MSWPTELINEVIGPLALSFETDEQTVTKIYVNHRLRVLKVRSIVTKAIAATDDGTIVVASALGTIGTITHAASEALNTEQSADGDVAYNRIEPNGYIQFTTAKSTAGGKVLVTVEAEREVAR